MNKLFRIILFLFVFSLMQLHGQVNNVQAYKIKAVFIFNFTRFVDWPSTSFKTTESPFVIGILGENPFGNYVEETITGESVGTHPIIVQYFKNENEISNCHLLYINYRDSYKLKETLNTLEEKSILTVSEDPDFSKLGGIIRFYTEQNRIRLEINTRSAKSAQLTISSKLLNLAKTN